MAINEIVQTGAKLLQLGLLRPADFYGATAIEFLFQGHPPIILEADSTNDSLRWTLNQKSDLVEVSLDKKLNVFLNLPTLWCWEMTNQQGYFDAFQLELWDQALKRERILQFKVAASTITIYECQKIGTNGST